MASNSKSALLSSFLTLAMLLLMTHSIDAGRQLSANTKDNAMKQGAWMKLGKDRGVLIPGIGRIMVPPCFGDSGGGSSSTPSYSGGGDSSSSSTPSYSGGGGTPTGSSSSPAYIPGGDDTFTSTPGVEIPAPPVLAAAHP